VTELSRILGQWTIRRRLQAGIGSIIVLLVAASVLGLVILRRTQRATRESFVVSMAVRDHLAASNDATRDFVVLAQSDLLSDSPASRARMDGLAAVADSVRRLLTAGSVITASERTRIGEIDALQSRIAVRLALARAAQDLGRRADMVHQTQLSEFLLDTLLAQSRLVETEEGARTEAELRAIGRVAATNEALMILAALAGLAVAMTFGVLTWRAVVRPLARLTETAQRMGGGDFHIALDPTGLDAEYRVVAEAFREMANRLSALVRRIQEQASEVATSATIVTGSSDEAARATGHISATVSAIAGAAGDQMAALTSSRAVLDLVGESANRLNETATLSTRLGEEIHETAAVAQRDIGEALETLRRAHAIMVDSADSVRRLDSASTAVAKFVVAIQNVADMTNLLSLNAAIEAARAGENGRGFAVVAEEVRHLSIGSGEAAANVRVVVEAMQRDVASATLAFTRAAGALEGVDDISRTATGALERIQAAVAGMHEVTGSLGAAAEANRSAVRELAGHMDATGQGALDQAAASEEAAAGAQESAATTAEMAAAAAHLLETAAELRKLVASFSV